LFPFDVLLEVIPGDELVEGRFDLNLEELDVLLRESIGELEFIDSHFWVYLIIQYGI